VVLAAGDEEQRDTGVVVVVDGGLLLAGLDVGQDVVPEDPAGRGDGVALVQRATPPR
jgi:hypothetical protein